MSGAVAVLNQLVAVMEDLARRAPAVKSAAGLAGRAREARAAVVELVEATHRFRGALAVVVIHSEQSAPAVLQDAAAKKYEDAADRLDAALTRIGGVA